MTRTQFTDARRNLQKQIISWISIVVIGLVALVAYLSLVYSSEAIRQSVSSYYNIYNFYDIEITSTLLMDEGNLAAIRAVPGVKCAEPVWMAGAKLLDMEMETTVTVQSLPEEISMPELMEGRLPEQAGECAIEQQLQKTRQLGIGDKVRISCSAVAGIDPLEKTEYVVTGVFRYPDHISFELPESPFLLVTEDSFNLDGLDGAFMKTRIRVEGTPDARFSKEYHDTVARVQEAINTLIPEQTAEREESIRAAYEKQLDAGQQKLDEAQQTLDDAEKQLDNGKEKLVSARKELDDGRAQLKQAEEQLTEAKKKLDDGSKVLVEAEYQIAAVQGLLYKAEGLIGIIDGLTGLEPSDYLPDSLSSQLQQARDGLKAYSEGRDLWYSSGEEYLDALTRYEQGKKRLELGEKEYSDGLAEYEKGFEEYEKGKADYENGVEELRQAREQADNIGACRWLVLSAYGSTGYIFAQNQASGLSSMSYSFSSLFLVIAVLVIYATVGRMVQEQRALIGTSKALGLNNREILNKYLFFGVSAALTAVVSGVGLTHFIVQKKVLSNYEPFFIFDSIPLCFRPLETAVVAVILPLVSGISVWLACKSLIRIPAIRLLQGEQPTSGRRKARYFSSRGLYTRLIFRNMRTDLRRVLVTIISIAGCCQLLVGGFMIKYAIERVNERQFGQIIQFEAELFFDPAQEEAERELAQSLKNYGLSYVLIGKHDFIIRNSESLSTATAVVAEPDSLKGYYGLAAFETKEELLPTDEGALIPVRMSEYLGIKVGDVLLAYDASLDTHKIPVSGVFSNHFGNLLFFTPNGYEQVFGIPAALNCFLVHTEGLSLSDLEDKVDDIAGFRQLRDAASDRERLDKLSSVLNAMIFMLLGLAGIMAYFIVMNLSVTYIQQKTRELTIMRINGFTVRECVSYVSWDLAITTMTGILLGLVAGHFLGQMVLPVTEGPYMKFVHEPDIRTYLYAALITAGFSFLVSSVALRRVKYLKLSDII